MSDIYNVDPNLAESKIVNDAKKGLSRYEIIGALALLSIYFI